jgi:hypothetical protein
MTVWVLTTSGYAIELAFFQLNQRGGKRMAMAKAEASLVSLTSIATSSELLPGSGRRIPDFVYSCPYAKSTRSSSYC